MNKRILNKRYKQWYHRIINHELADLAVAARQSPEQILAWWKSREVAMYRRRKIILLRRRYHGISDDGNHDDLSKEELQEYNQYLKRDRIPLI